MKIHQLFQKEIDRPINGVVKADQVEESIIWQELDEYVVTKEVKTNLDHFFSTYVDTFRNPQLAANSNGVWISGFFGSGKSHFLKILSYVLGRDFVTVDGKTKSPMEFLSSKPQCQDSLFIANLEQASRVSCDAILFNIDSKADAKKGTDALLKVFVNVFDEVCGYSPIFPHLAHIERMLEREGHFEKFKQEYLAQLGKDWIADRKAYRLKVKQIAKILSEVLGQGQESMEHMLINKDGSFSVTIEGFANTVNEYLDLSGSKDRVVFLVDEIGQYIGKNSDLMLNIQTITENLGTLCKGRAWVIVTSQEDMDKVIGEVNARQNQDFSKIQGRFSTRLSLASANTDEVIQNRLLEKKENCKNELTKIYREKGDILKNQLSFVNTGMTLESYNSTEDFVAHYPFPPYQYKLIQRVFQKLRDFRVTGGSTGRGERSMLKAFQVAATGVKDQETGILVPLWSFYSSIQETLDTIIKKTILDAEQAKDFDHSDVQLLKTLFLIRYVDEIPGTVDNLLSLSISKIDEDRKVLRHQIEESLQKLERETLVNRIGDQFIFLTNEERDIQNEIKGISLDTGESTKAISSMIFADILGEWKAYRYPENKKDFEFNRKCDGHPYGQPKDRNHLHLSIISPFADDYDLWQQEGHCIMNSNEQIVVRLPQSKNLYDDVSSYLKTDKYLRRDHSKIKASAAQVHEQIRREHREKKKTIQTELENLILNSTSYAMQTQVSLKTQSNAKARIGELLGYFVQNRFTKLNMIETANLDDKELIQEIKSVLLYSPDDNVALETLDSEINQRALKEVEERVKLIDLKGERILLKNEIENFGGMPYGWQSLQTALLMARLIVKGSIQLVIDGGEASPQKAIEVFSKPSSWGTTLIKRIEIVDEVTLKKALRNASDIFETSPSREEKPLVSDIKSELNQWENDLIRWESLAQVGYPGTSRIKECLEHIRGLLMIAASASFLKEFNLQSRILLDDSDAIYSLRQFHKSQKPVWDKLTQAILRFDLNGSYLRGDPTVAAKLDQLKSIQSSEEPYEQIKDVEGLIKSVEDENQKLIQVKRDQVLAKIEDALTRVTNMIDEMDAREKSHHCLRPLQLLKQEIQNQSSIPHIEAAANRITDYEEDADELIREYLKAQVVVEPAVTLRPVPGKGPQPIPRATKKIIPPKESIKLNVVSIASAKAIETTEEMESYLDHLRTRMEQAISEGKKIRITGN